MYSSLNFGIFYQMLSQYYFRGQNEPITPKIQICKQFVWIFANKHCPMLKNWRGFSDCEKTYFWQILPYCFCVWTSLINQFPAWWPRLHGLLSSLGYLGIAGSTSNEDGYFGVDLRFTFAFTDLLERTYRTLCWQEVVMLHICHSFYTSTF